jgi:uncharacterized protein
MSITLLAPALGLGVGFVLALTGAGGAILAVPLLLFGLHLTVAQAAPISLLAVALAAGVGAALALRARTLRYRAAGVMAAAGLAMAPVGQWLAHRLPERPLTVLFAAVLALAAARTLLQANRELRGEEAARPAGTPCQRDPATGRLRWTGACAGVLVFTGALTGLLSGLLGVGGGFVLVPAMIYILGMPTAVVIGTSNFQILFVAANVTFLQAATNGTVDVVLALLLILGGVVGAPIGSRLAAKLPGVVLRGLMSVLILLVALELLTELLRTPSSLYSLGTRQVLP